MTTRAELDVDLYTDEAILEPHPLYRAIRDRAAAVWLPVHQVWALGRYDDVRAALRADGALISGRGTGLTALVNDMPAEITLNSDGETHRKRRAVRAGHSRAMRHDGYANAAIARGRRVVAAK